MVYWDICGQDERGGSKVGSGVRIVCQIGNWEKSKEDWRMIEGIERCFRDSRESAARGAGIHCWIKRKESRK